MNKFIRFFVAAILYIICWIVMFLVIPSISWVFGANFLDVVQLGPYIGFMITIGNTALGIVFSELFDKEYYFKP